MAVPLNLRYVQVDNNGRYRYRRGVPQRLRSVVGKTEFLKVLGKTEAELLKNYGSYHEKVERILEGAATDGSFQDQVSARAYARSVFEEHDLDPYSSGKDEDERTSRSEAADRILAQYPANPQTGSPDASDLTPTDQIMVDALLSGVENVTTEPTILQAFEFYEAEKTEPDPHKRKKKQERHNRIKRQVLEVTGQDLKLSQVKRAHAREVRDALLKRMKASSAKRMITIVKAVFALAIRENDLAINNPFSGLNYPQAEVADIELREALPIELIQAIYTDLRNNPVLQDIWTLLHHTGAQSAEILSLQGSELVIDDEVPHLLIQPNRLRSLKELARRRSVPLVGQALSVARRLATATKPDAPVFPGYAATSTHTNFSQSLNKRLKRFRTNEKQKVYGLRHRMKDELRRTNCGPRIENAIMGHSDGGSSQAQYGSSVTLAEKLTALDKIDFQVPNCSFPED